MISDITAEQCVVAKFITNPEVYQMLAGRVSPDSFTDPDCKTIFKAIAYYSGNGNVVDFAFLDAAFKSLGRLNDADAVSRIVKSATHTHNIEQIIDLLEELRLQRAYQALASRLIDSIGESSETLSGILDRTVQELQRNTATDILDKVGLANRMAELINENRLNPENKAILSGLRIFDESGGLPPATEVVVAAFSSQGKSALGLTILNNAMCNGINCAVYSMEMGAISIGSRIWNMMGWNVRTVTLKTQPLFDNTVAHFNQLADEFIARSGNIFVDESSTNNADNIIASITKLHRENDVRLVMVDYLQIIPCYDSSGDSDQEQLAKISRRFQAVAKKLDICIIVLSQFSRPPKGSTHQPSEDLIRGSGQIFEACDISLYIYRPYRWKESYPAPFSDAETDGTAMLQIGKYRDGESGKTTIVGFDGPKTMFYDFTIGTFDPDPDHNYPKATAGPVDEENDKYKF